LWDAKRRLGVREEGLGTRQRDRSAGLLLKSGEFVATKLRIAEHEHDEYRKVIDYRLLGFGPRRAF